MSNSEVITNRTIDRHVFYLNVVVATVLTTQKLDTSDSPVTTNLAAGGYYLISAPGYSFQLVGGTAFVNRVGNGFTGGPIAITSVPALVTLLALVATEVTAIGVIKTAVFTTQVAAIQTVITNLGTDSGGNHVAAAITALNAVVTALATQNTATAAVVTALTP